MEFFIQNASLIILFPLWISVLIFIGKFAGVLKSKKIVFGLTLLSSIFGLIFSIPLFALIAASSGYVYENTFNFLCVNDFSMELGILLDLTSVFMLLIVYAVTLPVQIYSYSYMKNDDGFIRFFALMNFFTFAMCGLVSSPTLFQTYIFWELVGTSSYLLISFWYKKTAAANAGKKAFVMNRIGDCCLLAGIIISSVILFNFAGLPDLADIPYSSIDRVAACLFTYTSEPIFIILCILLIFGSIAKSAQFPLHTWLADAMEGPTPVSALIHSATMVAAGVFLISRLYPIYYQSVFVMNFILAIGLFTAVITAIFAIVCKDIKRILAYSTSSQLGIMFMALGSGALTGGMVYLASHAFIKSMLFLCAGIIMTLYAGKTSLEIFGGLRRKIPVLAFVFLIGAFALSGILFSGFSAKTLIFHHLLETHSYYIIAVLLIISFMTSFYIFRMYFIVFESSLKNDTSKNLSYAMLIPVIVICFVVLVLGFFLPRMAEIKFEIIPVSVELCAVIFAYICYVKIPKLPKIPVLYNLAYNGFYIDDIYTFAVKHIYGNLCSFANYVDDVVFDGVVVLTVFLAKLNSWFSSKFQTGLVQSYICYSVVIIAMLLTGFCLIYSLVAYFAEV
ncbi:NADH-quinone oxidoreductase subunit L [bacterium]|nr:NADH-quinone oxidoreductase subunit L [bacterium]